MSAEVVLFRNKADLAWEKYASLIRQMNDDPSLRADRQHVERTLSAYREFSSAFLGDDA